MTLGYNILILLLIGAGMYARYQYKLKELESKANLIALKFKENNDLLANLNSAIEDIASQRKLNKILYREINQKHDLVRQIHAENQIMLAHGHETLKENKFQVYNVRQASMYLYQQYRSISDLFRHILVAYDDGESPVFEHIRNAMQNVDQGANEVENYFKMYFKITPDQYLNAKKDLRGKRPDGSDYITKFSAS